MDTHTALQKAESLLQPFSIEVARHEPDRVDVVVAADRLLAAVEALVAAKWGYLSAITGLDEPAPKAKAAPGNAAPAATESADQLEVLYHFSEGAAVTTLRVRLPYSAPVVPSVCGWIPAATLYERELIEMFGITVEGTPDSQHLLLPEDWPEGVYPLRKAFSGTLAG